MGMLYDTRKIKTVCLSINIPKTKAMRINTSNSQQIKIENEIEKSSLFATLAV